MRELNGLFPRNIIQCLIKCLKKLLKLDFDKEHNEGKHLVSTRGHYRKELDILSQNIPIITEA